MTKTAERKVSDERFKKYYWNMDKQLFYVNVDSQLIHQYLFRKRKKCGKCKTTMQILWLKNHSIYFWSDGKRTKNRNTDREKFR